MKHNHTAEISKRQSKLSARLSRQSGMNKNDPVFSGGNEELAMSHRIQATNHGGIALIHRLVCQVGLAKEIDNSLSLLKNHCPYHESDHILNIAYNVLCGGRTLDDIENLRQDAAYMDALGAERIPDPTTAGDFLRRFELKDITALQMAINTTRMKVWKKQPKSFFKRAIIDIDGTIVGTEGECKEGMDMSYKGIWGFAPLLVTLANTKEVLFTRNRSGNRPSHDGAFDYLDPAVDLVRSGGFKKVLLRGDTGFSSTEKFDYWTKSNVQFVFGIACKKNLVELADAIENDKWTKLRRDGQKTLGKNRAKMDRVKDERIRYREYRHITLEEEHYSEFSYQPTKCQKTYRVVVVRKALRIEKGQQLLVPEIRYFFYISNAPKSEMTARQVIRHSNERCDQENLIEQTKNGVHAMRMPCREMLANDAYIVAASLAWNLKAWTSLLWHDKTEGETILKMEFRRFANGIIEIPCQVVKSGRRIIHRFLAYTIWLESVFKTHARLRRLKFA